MAAFCSASRQSLFPPFSISCEPICAAAVTARRLMAGYVLYHSGDDVATVLYGELSPHTRGSELARLAFYENEQCQRSLAALKMVG